MHSPSSQVATDIQHSLSFVEQGVNGGGGGMCTSASFIHAFILCLAFAFFLSFLASGFGTPKAPFFARRSGGDRVRRGIKHEGKGGLDV
ncbi:hypothetical protein CC80DRAFT_494569 [Byssothecium circinans]|uniref:Transmembrane protein n=1 Tax=Byssothecium circinans TaxID=147558 RepID=A0A6A5TKU2_9PLEO|nr:hypothetical protein CC80DRAFT_494569 [Byssothecium circinans]